MSASKLSGSEFSNDHRNVRSVGALRLDTASRSATLGQLEVQLTERESALLELLLRHPGIVITRERAVDEIWGAAQDNVVDRYVTNLRRKLGEPLIIRTVRGVGFVLEP